MASLKKWARETPRGTAVADAAVPALKQRLGAVRHFLPLAANQWQRDVEYVHQLRIWSRRSAAAIDVFRMLLPTRRANWLDRQLTRIRKACNDARDDDVLTLRLSADRRDRGARSLLKRVRKHRRTAQKPIARISRRLEKNKRFKRRAAALLTKTERKGRRTPWCNVEFGPWADEQIAMMLDDFSCAGAADLSEIDLLHRFRIVGKRLRYAMELLYPAFPPEFRNTLYGDVVEIQERLGRINDYATARVRLSRWLESADSLAESRYLEMLIDREQAALAESQQEFLDWWTAERAGELQVGFARFLPIAPGVSAHAVPSAESTDPASAVGNGAANEFPHPVGEGASSDA